MAKLWNAIYVLRQENTTGVELTSTVKSLDY